MQQFSSKTLSWWYTKMVPTSTSTMRISEREFERKRRLLSILMFFAWLLSVIPALTVELTLPSARLSNTIGFSIPLVALWLNRKGYLKSATLLFLSGSLLSILLEMQMTASSSPFSLLWLGPIAGLLLVAGGLCLPASMVFLAAITENVVLFWYYLIEQKALMIHLLSPLALQNFLVYLCIFIYASALVGAICAITTKNAVIQADRAIELEQTHQELSKAHELIQKQALTDGLTNLLNHRAIMNQITKEIEVIPYRKSPFSLLFFDTDHFKQINDTYGHGAGDSVLYQIGQHTRSVLREQDVLGRFGGEEFVVLLPETPRDEAQIIAERIRMTIDSTPMNITETGQTIHSTVSIGIATYQEGCTEQDVLERADQAMYRAKRAGRNQVSLEETCTIVSTGDHCKSISKKSA